jgi:transcriptional regulator with XRE-family HTH domain
MLLEQLRVLRAERQLTLRELQARSGVSKDTISDLERGLRKPRPITLAKLADALGIDTAELLEIANPPKDPRPLSAEWALSVPREVLSREVETADTDRLHKLLSELVGDEYTRTLEDAQTERGSRAKREQAARRAEAFSRAADEVWIELRKRGEKSPEKGLPAFRKYLEALGYV